MWNAAAFQVAWPLCVLGGNAIALAVTLCFLAAHLYIAQNRLLELGFIAFCAVIGLIVDMMLLASGILVWHSSLPPLWMSCLWVLFGGCVGHSFKWFDQRLVLAGAFAGLFAPLSYLAGTRLTQVGLREPEFTSLVIIACAWAFIFPSLLHSHRLLLRRHSQ